MATLSINQADIQDQLDRLLQSQVFRQSGTLSRFLKFVVQESLAGRDLELKEYTIALTVLGKKTDFNPQKDPIVRIHAGRLRRALSAYYSDPGKNDPLIIDIPKGTYVPEIRANTPALQKEIATKEDHVAYRRRISVGVLPFSNINTNDATATFAEGLCDHLCTELTRYAELSVISYYSSRQIISKTTDIREAGLMLDAAYILTGSIQTDKERMRIRVQLILSETREQLWANTYDITSNTESLFKIQDDIVWQVVSQTAGHYGAIARNIAKLPASKNPSDVGVYNAIFWYYHFVRDLSLEMFHKAEEAMRKAVATDPDYALGWAVLGEVLVGGFFMGFQSKHTNQQLAAAIEYGKRAIKIDPSCQHGYQTIALANLFTGHHAESLKTIADWEKRKPYEAGIMGAMGFILICCGRYDTGFQLLDDSIQLNPYYQWWFNAGLCFYYLHHQQYDNVLYWAEKMNRPEVPWEYMLRLTALVAMQRNQEAMQLRLNILDRFPLEPEQAKAYLSMFLADSLLIGQIHQALFPTAFMQAE